MRFWAEETTAGSRPVTTVHFGGGTPNALDEGCLAAIVCECRDRFAVMEATEWAIETTAGLLTDSELFRLQKLGFSRLHVGVQTLDERLRRRLGRQTPVATVIERLRRAKAAGFVTSVDVIYGLPEQDACSLLNTLGALIASGIHGVSLYRLNLSQKNLRILKAFPGFRPSPLCDYLLLQCAEQRLIAAGYSKNHFVHYALPPDDDLYFRHAFRGEDLIGLGASASGNIGRLEYRCVEYPSYLAESWGRPAIEGTVLASPRTEALASLHATMMCGQPDRALAYAMHCDDLFDEWLSCGLVRPLSAESHVLTAVGSWLLSKMLREVMVHSEC
jgi:oxygen-independent coproporphyrinogen-3 oxidase